jgi:putative peptidoglycan binding protein/N-acetylmuramoyl-L-alanine amidase-like protein
MEIITRKDWGARSPESRTSIDIKDRTGHVFHHTTGTNLGNDDCGEWWRNIQTFHMDTNGWADIGYNWGFCRHGQVFEGRGWNTLGAHVAGHNTENLGYVLLGDGRLTSNLTTAAKEAAVWLRREGERRAGHQLAERVHGDLGATECPGGVMRTWVKAGLPLPVPGNGDTPGAGESFSLKMKPLVRRSEVRPDPNSDLGAEVRRIQAELYHVHKLTDVGPADGWPGPRFDAAVRAFQARKKLTVDGIVGPQTWPALLQ